MDAPLFPFGWIFRLIAWGRDLCAMPGRVRTLVEGYATARDPRPPCLKCGSGRVGFHERRNNASGRPMAYGQCGQCGQVWRTSDDCTLLLNPVEG